MNFYRVLIDKQDYSLRETIEDLENNKKSIKFYQY